VIPTTAIASHNSTIVVNMPSDAQWSRICHEWGTPPVVIALLAENSESSVGHTAVPGALLNITARRNDSNVKPTTLRSQTYTQVVTGLSGLIDFEGLQLGPASGDRLMIDISRLQAQALPKGWLIIFPHRNAGGVKLRSVGHDFDRPAAICLAVLGTLVVVWSFGVAMWKATRRHRITTPAKG
jgi:hypothetical protein